MKHLSFILACLFSVSSYCQTKISMYEETAAIDGISRNCITTLVPGGDAGDVSKAFKKELKDLKGKVSDKKFLFADDCKLKSMGDNTFDVYAMVQDVGEAGAKVVVAFDLGGAYVNSKDHPDRFEAAQNMVRDFAIEQTKEAIKLEVNEAEKVLNQLEKDQVGFEKDKEKLEKGIVENEAKIEENLSSIEQNVVDQTAKQKEVHRLEGTQIEGQIEEVQKIIKGFKKELDGLVKDKNGLEKDNRNLLEKIKKANSDIKQNLKDQANQKSQIEEQKSEIKVLEIKLNSVN